MNPPSQAGIGTSIPSMQPHHNYMETIDSVAEYRNYWETKMFWNEELNSWTMDQRSNFGCYDSSSLDGNASMIATKNIVAERSRRKKLNDKLLALREAVPKISKLDKASIIKDAIDYIQDLQEQERRLQAEIMELESKRMLKNTPAGYDFEHELPVMLRSKKTRSCCQIYDHRDIPIEVHELRVSSMGEKTLLISLTCNQTPSTMIKLCDIFESLNLKIITANVANISGMVKKTVLIEVDEEEKEDLMIQIEEAISVLILTGNEYMDRMVNNKQKKFKKLIHEIKKAQYFTYETTFDRKV